MRSYVLGTYYEFIINHFYTTFDEYGRTKMWLSLSDGESGRKFNVPAYPYQSTGLEGKTISCKVTRIMDNGYPYLFQDKKDVVEHCYNEGETYWFSVGDKVVDPNSRRPYYKLIDRVNNIDWLRYYCSDQTDLNGVVGFVVNEIKDGYLDLTLSDTKEVSSGTGETNEERSIANPFGHEDENHEWKSSIVFPSETSDQEDLDVEKQIQTIMRSIAGFNNAEGGLLYLGVTDSGEVRGIEADYPYLDLGAECMTYQKSPDGYENKIRNAVNRYLGKSSLGSLKFSFYYQVSSKKVFCIIEVGKTDKPVYRDGKEVYKRFGNGYRQLRGDEITELVLDKHDDHSEQKEFTRPMPTDCQEYNPNNTVDVMVESEANIGVVRIGADVLKKVDYYYMTFFTDNHIMYSKESHASDPNVLCEVRFNKIDGNMEYSRDLLAKCSVDGHVQFLQAYDVCKLGNADEMIDLPTSTIATVKVVHKYDFLKVLFNDGTNDREKYLRVLSLFGKDTENTLKANKDTKRIKYEFKLKGNSLIPSKCTLISVQVVHETLPDEIQFVSPRGGSLGIGSVVGSQEIDIAQY